MIPGFKNTDLIKLTLNYAGAKWPMLVLMVGMLLLSACENDLKAIQKISAQEVSKPISTTTGLDVIYSDNALVKAHLTAPLLIEYTDKLYREMPKGLRIISYDAKQQKESEIVADYGLQRENDNVIELRKNVVATNEKGETFKSDELIWDQNKKEYHSDKAVQILLADGSIMNGTNFKSDESMSHWTMDNSTGQITVSQNAGQ